MDLAALEATFAANRTPLLAAAGAGVVGLGLYAKKKKATAAATPGTGNPALEASSGGQTAGMTGGAAYDSSASDLYGAIQPQLESLGGQLTDLRNLYGSRPPTPVPAPTPAPTPSTGGGVVGVPAGEVPTPVPAVPSKAGYYTQQINAAGGNAAYTPTPGGSYVGRIDSTATPLSQQYYTPVATGVGTQALMSTSALPQTGSLGPVGSLINNADGRWQVTGYTFNGAPNLSAVNSAGQVIGFDGKPIR